MTPLDMDQDLKRRRIATTGLVACVLLMTVTAAYPLLQARLGAASTSGYRLGEVIDLPQDVFRDAAHTVVVFARSSCAASQRMKPLLARLAGSLSDDPSIDVVLVTPRANAPAESAFADQIGIEPRHHLAMDLTTLKVVRVPTVVVLNRRGEVEYVQDGQPQTAAAEAALLQAVAAARQEP